MSLHVLHLHVPYLHVPYLHVLYLHVLQLHVLYLHALHLPINWNLGITQDATRSKHNNMHIVFGSAWSHVLFRVQGIKITDADSKKKAVKLLKAEQAMRQMDIDSDASDSGSDVEMK